jgi:hypothetical protein
MMDIKDCLEKRFLVKTKPDIELSNKELNEARYDFEKAQRAFEDDGYKWSIVTSSPH